MKPKVNINFLAVKVLARFRIETGNCKGVYASYDDANKSSVGYESISLLDTILEKTRKHIKSINSSDTVALENMDLTILTALGLIAKKKQLNVIDIGGGCGIHYFIARRFFKEQIGLRWHVVETPMMVDKAKEFENSELYFFDSLGTACTRIGLIDLIFSSGTLQYVPDPTETLRELTACGAEYIFLTRLGLTIDGKEFTTVQRSLLAANGPGPVLIAPHIYSSQYVTYPVRFLRKDQVEKILNERYEIQVQINEERGLYSLGRYRVDMFGYFARTRSVINRPI